MYVEPIGRMNNYTQSINRKRQGVSFSGDVHKSVRQFLKETHADESVLQSITELVSNLHKDTVLRMRRCPSMYIPLIDSSIDYQLIATNKNFPNDKYAIALVGLKEGLFGKVNSLFNMRLKTIIETLPHIDAIFVQHAKNRLHFEKQGPNKVAREAAIKKFAAEANVDYNKEVDLNRYPSSTSHFYRK